MMAGLLLAGLGLAPYAAAAGIHAASYDMAVRCIPAEAKLEGEARIGLREAGRPGDVLRFWLHGELRVTSVRAGGADLEFTQQGEYYAWDYSLIGTRVQVSLPKGLVPEALEVKWEGFMNPSRARSPSDYMRIDTDGVFLRALGYSPWFPILLDQKEDAHAVDFTSVRIEVPKGMTAVFAGELVRSTVEGALSRSEWRAGGLSLFDAQLTARPFTVIKEGDISIYSLDDAGSMASARAILDFSRSLLAIYRERYAQDAVVGQLHIVEMPRFGDIASGSVMGVQEESWRSFDPSHASGRTLAHELVHPFVQPAIATSDPLYALAIEGFPSYFHYPALAALGALDDDQRMAEIRDSYLAKRRTGQDRRGRPLPEEKPITRITADEIGEYKDVYVLSDRALLFLDDLRKRMGESGFQTFTRKLFAMKALDDRSFRDLVLAHLPGFEPRLTLWLDSTGLPDPPSD
jgi:hypothetical protein